MVRIHKIEASSLVDGPGRRTVVFFQGCTLACKGCQNHHIWPADGGNEVQCADLAQSLILLAAAHGNLTISGGEPFQQPQALAELVARLKWGGVKHILVYTGYTWEQLLDPRHPAHPWVKEILTYVDVLVDGPFLAKQDDPFITWRGSRNQRPIDVAASLEEGQVVTLDWDAPEIVIDEQGNLLFPIGLADDLAEIGDIAETRRCGQTRSE